MREECETWDESKFVVRHSSLLYFFFQQSGRALGHARRRGHLAGGAALVRECGGGDGSLRGEFFAARVCAHVLHAFLLARRVAFFVAGGTPGGLLARRVVFEKHPVEHAHDADCEDERGQDEEHEEVFLHSRQYDGEHAEYQTGDDYQKAHARAALSRRERGQVFRRVARGEAATALDELRERVEL